MKKREDLLTPELITQIQQHAIEDFPNEACGLIVAGQYIRHPNLAEDPTQFAMFPKDAVLEYLQAGTLEAFVHSHPGGPNFPSSADMIMQMEYEIPFVIVATNGEACYPPFIFGDQVERLPLIGRGFQHAVSDCYELIRDYYFVERGITLKQFPRDWEWWLHGQTLYTDGFISAGFREISKSSVEDGDVILFAVRSQTPNHAGIYLSGDLLLHHVSSNQGFDPTRLSRREPLNRWAGYATHYLRYEGTPDQ